MNNEMYGIALISANILVWIVLFTLLAFYP